MTKAKNGAAPSAPPLPANLDAERSILGAILLDNSLLAAVAKELPPDQQWFYLEPNRKVYLCMLAMAEAAETIDLVTLANALQKRGEIEAVNPAYIVTLVDGVPHATPAHVAHYCRIVREKAQLRRAIYFAHQLQDRILEGQTEAAEVFAELRSFSGTETRFNGQAANGAPLGRTLQQIMETEFPVPDHLIEGLVPRSSSVMFYAKPHCLKSWLLLALTLRSSIEGQILGGKLTVNNPVRTLLLTVEDPPSYTKQRLQEMMLRPAFGRVDSSQFRIVMRDEVPGFHLPNKVWMDTLLRAAEQIKAEHIILDVVRKILRPGMDLNKPSDTAEFVHCLEEIQDATGACVTLSHHEKKSASGIMEGAAGSINLVSWSKVVARLSGKHEENKNDAARRVTTVQMETDNAWAMGMDDMRLILQLGAPDPLRLEDASENTALVDSMRDKLTDAPSGFTLADVMWTEDCSKPTAHRMVTRLREQGDVVKVTGSKTAKGGMARYKFVDKVKAE